MFDYVIFGWCVAYVFVGLVVGTCVHVWLRERGETDDALWGPTVGGGIFWFIPVVIAIAYPFALKVEAVYLRMSEKAEERRNR